MSEVALYHIHQMAGDTWGVLHLANSKPHALQPLPYTLNPKPHTPTPKPQILIPTTEPHRRASRSP